MASNFQIQKPYVLTSLPRPLNQADRRYAIGDVFGQQDGSKKKKRPELTVGVDGEAANIYDVVSSRLVTSYPVPPQAVFTCPPCSSRWRSAKSKEVARYTYISTADPSPKITAFKDLLGSAGNTTSTSASKKLSRSTNIVHVTTTSSSPLRDSLTARNAPDLIAITSDASILCLDGESLTEKWQSSSDILSQELGPAARGKLVVEHAATAAASDVLEGLFGGRQDVFGVFADKVQEGGFDPDILTLVTSVVNDEQPSHYLHVLALPASETRQSLRQNVIPLHTAPVGDRLPRNPKHGTTFRLDLRAGALLELRGDRLVSYNIAASIPKVDYRMKLSGVSSALRISKTSVLTASASSFDVYNPTFKSLQTSTPLILSDKGRGEEKLEEKPQACELVSYFARLQIAVALVNTSLVAVQLDAPKARDRKRRAEGLLIDSIGRGISAGRQSNKKLKSDANAIMFSSFVPGSVSAHYLTQWEEETRRADLLLADGNLRDFEVLLAGKFGVQVKSEEHLFDGTTGTGEGTDAASSGEAHDLPDWEWPHERKDYPRADRRWIIYAISRVFAWQQDSASTNGAAWLKCQLSESHVLNYLADAGHLTVTNLKSAFKDYLRDLEDVDYALSRQLPETLTDIDPSMDLLLTYLAGSKLNAYEILSAVRLIMRSLELVQDPVKLAPKLLAAESTGEGDNNGDQEATANTDVGKELDKLEQELQVAENYLGDEGSIRARGLSVAFSKLNSCPHSATLTALRRILKPEEILSLIWVLRMELSKDGWTTRYLDSTRLDQDGELDPPPDGSIKLIAELLCRCLDAVGPGGWLINDAIIAAGQEDAVDSADFLTNLKHEVSAALEGIQEAAVLQTVVGQVVKYASRVNRQDGKKSGSRVRDGVAVSAGQPSESSFLPLGSKLAQQPPSSTKLVSGGELVHRSKRELGHLVSQQVPEQEVNRIRI